MTIHKNDDDIIHFNEKLLTKGDNSEIHCEMHNITKKWGDLSSITQLAILSGLDIEGPVCIMEEQNYEKKD